MIVFAGSTLLLVLWTAISLRSLRSLRRERQQVVERGWHDWSQIARNRRAVLVLVLWSAAVTLWLGSLMYIDSAFGDLGRAAGLTERVLLIVIGIALFWSWDRD